MKLKRLCKIRHTIIDGVIKFDYLLAISSLSLNSFYGRTYVYVSNNLSAIVRFHQVDKYGIELWLLT